MLELISIAIRAAVVVRLSNLICENVNVTVTNRQCHRRIVCSIYIYVLLQKFCVMFQFYMVEIVLTRSIALEIFFKECICLQS